jgi:hypothetical protein
VSRHAGEQTRNTRHWAIAGSLLGSLLIIVACAAAVIALKSEPEPAAASATPTSQAPPPQPPPAPAPAPAPATGLQESFAQFQRETFGGEIAGLVVQPIGRDPITVAPWDGETFAWSTIKVPLAIAALREGLGEQLDADIKAALTVSDNEAAERIWAALGSGAEAAGKVQDVLADPATVVQAERVRPPFTPFGQTKWQPENQAGFLSRIACETDDPVKTVLTLMGQVSADTWGLGQIQGTKFKGGWGPGEHSGYLVRQFGILTDAAGAPTTIVAVIVEPGSFEEGQQDLTSIATWLTQHRAELPAGACPSQP